MKTLGSIFIFVLFNTLTVLSQGYTTKFISLNNNIELGKRFLKLGNTYRIAGDYVSSDKYLNKGLNIVTKCKNLYWTAVALEFYGYYYRDIGDIELSIEFINKAKIIYDESIVQDDGSPYAIRLILEQLQNKYTSLVEPNEEDALTGDEGKEQVKPSDDSNDGTITLEKKEIPLLKKETTKKAKIIPTSVNELLKYIRDKIKESRLEKTGYPYQYENIIIDMYGNKIILP